MKRDDEAIKRGVVIPRARLPDELLERVIESFVLEEGTDYGEQQFSLSEKIKMVKSQLDRGELDLVFDPDTETCSLRMRGAC